MANELKTNQQLIDNHIDDHVDEEIEQCFSRQEPKCFFMFAGAGSGKTSSLIKALTFLDKRAGNWLAENSKKIAIITYTNAACDEISRRLQYKPIFAVSTIHSFLWEIIKNYQKDIKSWITKSLQLEIEDLQEKQQRGRGGKASEDRAAKIVRKQQRLARIASIKKFSYNPNGENVGYDSLSHDEVIKIGSEFISSEPTMQEILISKYPILLIDESQDTKKELIDAIFVVCEKYKGRFIVGMLGDTMQRIYTHGKENLADCIPKDWAKPQKVMNHRSAHRIVKLANMIRRTVDDQYQVARSDAEEGFVRLFITTPNAAKKDVEKQVSGIMAKETKDNGWNNNDYKSLILEHLMVARRLGFYTLYEPLHQSGVFDTSLRDGSIAELSFLANVIVPLVNAYKTNSDFDVAKIVKRYSPLLKSKTLSMDISHQTALLQKVEDSVDALLSLWKDSNAPSCIDILRSIRETELFPLNDRVDDLLSDPIDGEPVKIAALRAALLAPFDMLEKYSAYVSDNTRFATHQGVKGLEFPRVMVIVDDAEAKGFSFSYEKLFGAKGKTATDIKNEKDGRDTTTNRTARLFYVACTRAQKSLAVIVYTENPEAVKATSLSHEWFNEDEIHIL